MVRRLIATRRLRSRLLIGVIVLIAHLIVVDRLLATVAGWSDDAGRVVRMQIVYRSEMNLSEPPAQPPSVAAPPAAAADRRARRPLPQAAAASAAEPAVGDSSLAAETPAAAPADVASAAERPASAVAPAPAADGVPIVDAMADAGSSSASDAAAPVFEWPASTRLSYLLTGNFRGEIHGSAQVEWINAAPRYQVHLDVTVGLPFAPLFSRQMSSDGRLTPQGLLPERYDEQNQRAFGAQRRQRLLLDEDGVTLADGRRWPRQPFAAAAALEQATMQDSASQFVQLTYLFTTRPQPLAPGTTIAFPLALPGRVADWVYEVGQRQTLHTRFGAIEAFHVFPQRGIERGDELLAQAWFAPQLAYLPVRIRIEQNAATYLDMMIERRPEIAAP